MLLHAVGGDNEDIKCRNKINTGLWMPARKKKTLEIIGYTTKAIDTIHYLSYTC